MTTDMSKVQSGDMTKVQSGDLGLGRPLPFSVYDQNGVLLLKAGIVINLPRQMERLLEGGVFYSQTEAAALRRTPSHHPASAALPEAEVTNAFEMLESVKARLYRVFINFRNPNYHKEVLASVEDVALTVQEACQYDTDSALASLHLDYDSSYSVVHHLQAGLLCELVGKRLGIKEEARLTLIKAAITHDIGLHDIQDTLDRQVAPLSEAQKARIQSHPSDSARILGELGVTDRVWLDAVQNHHERIDGSGYPAHCSGDVITPPARILAVADIYSAMVRDRPYRKAMVSKEAMRQLLIDQGKTTDARVTQIMIKEVGVFPPGTIVKLANGEVAVVKERSDNATTPVVYAFMRPDDMPRLSPSRRETALAEYAIEGMMPFSRYKGSMSIIRGLWGAGKQ